MSELPNGWAEASLKELSEDISYGFTTSASSSNDLPRLLRITDLQDNSVDWENVPHCSEIPDPKFELKTGDIVVARTGATTGKNHLISTVPGPTVFASYLIRIRSAEGVEPAYVSQFMKSLTYWAHITKVSKGVAQPGANATVLGELEVPLPPQPEQKRIVTKLDTLCASTSNAREHLAAIAKLEERYKLAVLETAYFGPQTSEWERISFLDTTESTQNGLSKRRGDEGKPSKVLRLADLSGNVFVGEDPREIVLTEKEEERFSLLPGDILIVRVNGSEKIVGRMLVWANEPEWCYCDHFIRARVSSAYNPSFVRWLFETNTIRAQIEATFVSSAGQKTINKTILSQVKVPDIPIEDQCEIVLRIEVAFSKIDRLAAEASKALKLTDRLDERIIAKAFAGELVPQDPNDEPASALLDRIREARANAPKKTRPRRTKATTMKKDPKDLLLADSAKWPENGVTSEELAKRVVMPHSDLRDALFELLGGTRPQLEQVFDKTEERMRLKPVAQ